MSRRRRNETEEQRARRELISDFLSAANIQSMDDIQALFKEALAGFMEDSLESELDDELGYEPYDVKNKETDNSRNGHSKKTLRTSMGSRLCEKISVNLKTVIKTLSCERLENSRQDWSSIYAQLVIYYGDRIPE